MAETMKLHRLSRVKLPTGEKSLDSVKRSKAINSNERSRGQEILMEAQGYYSSGYRFRNERDRPFLTDKTCTIHSKNHMQILHGNIMDNLIIRTLQE